MDEEAGPPDPADQAHGARGDGAARPGRRRLRRRHRRGRRHLRRLGARAPGDPDRGRGEGRRSGSATPGPSSSARTRRSRSATTCAGSNHVLPTGGTARHTSGLSVHPYLRVVNVIECDRDVAAATSPRTWTPSAGPRTCAAHVRRRPNPRSPEGPQARAASDNQRERHCPFGMTCGPCIRTARRSSTCPYQLNTNENPYAPSPALQAAIADAVAAVAGTLNRYPDRDAVDLRAGLAAYLGHGLHRQRGLGRERVERDHPAAAAGVRRPGPHRAGLRALVLDAPADRPGDRAPRWRSAHPRRRLWHVDGRRPGRERHQPDVVFITSPNNPTGTAVPARPHRGHLRRGARHGHRRRGLRGVLPRRHAVGADAAARAPAAGGHPDHVEGVRRGRDPAGLPRRRPRGDRRAAAGPAALSPVHGHPGGGAGRAGARRRAAGHRRARCARSATRSSPGCARTAACGSPTATRTSCCSARSPTGTRSGRRCWTAAC